MKIIENIILQSNATSIGRYKVIRGKKNIRDLGRVLEYNGLTELDAWYEDECNVVTGTDGTIFAPFHEKEEGFTVFIPQMCRAIRTDYQYPSSFAGINTNRHTMSFDVTKYGESNCYCRNGEECPPKGILDLFPCTGAPIGISLPHFYEGNCCTKLQFNLIYCIIFVHVFSIVRKNTWNCVENRQNLSITNCRNIIIIIIIITIRLFCACLNFY